MPDVTMWWVRTQWSWNTPAGLAITPRPTHLELNGNLWGPTRTNGGLLERKYTIKIVHSYWLGTDRMPATGSDWKSKAQDRTEGLIVGYTFGDAWPFAFAKTALTRYIRQRVYSGSTLIARDERYDKLIDVVTPYTSGVVSLPLHGVIFDISNQTFNFDRTQDLGIQVEMELVIFFRGDGRMRFDTVRHSVPQFDIGSTT